jgi:hypothetical protein
MIAVSPLVGIVLFGRCPGGAAFPKKSSSGSRSRLAAICRRSYRRRKPTGALEALLASSPARQADRAGECLGRGCAAQVGPDALSSSPSRSDLRARVGRTSGGASLGGLVEPELAAEAGRHFLGERQRLPRKSRGQLGTRQISFEDAPKNLGCTGRSVRSSVSRLAGAALGAAAGLGETLDASAKRSAKR